MPLFSSYKAYLEKLKPSQVESIKKLKKKLSEDKVKRQMRRDKKRESEFLGKPKYPGNAFILYVATLDRGEATCKVCLMLLLKYDFDRLVIYFVTNLSQCFPAKTCQNLVPISLFNKRQNTVG